MNLDNVHDINLLKSLLKKCMVRLIKDVHTPTREYKAGEWYFIEQYDFDIEIWFDDPTTVLAFTYDEANEYLEPLK